MVFYFSGTDNSKHVAESLGDSRIVNIAKALNQKKCRFTLKENEPVGFVCPVYYSGVPKTVLEFVRHMNLVGEITYVYMILTHGGGPGGAGSMLEHELKKKGYPLHAYFDVKMPSNYIMFGTKNCQEKADRIILEAEPAIKDIKTMVDARNHVMPEWSRVDRILTGSMYLLCDSYMSTKKFYADNTCTGCGLCVRRCPSKCIEMVNERPSWTKNKCVRCMACLRCNAVQFNKKSKDYYRYYYKKVNKI